MTFHTLLGPSDPRVQSGILARMMLQQLKHPRERASDPVALCILNFVRLLEMYRYGAMRSTPTPLGILEATPKFVEEIGEPEGMDPLQKIEEALKDASKSVFRGVRKKNVVVDKVQNTLRWHLESEAEHSAPPPEKDVKDVVKFLTEFLRSLDSE